MAQKSCKETFVVLNEKGLHTRPTTELVKLASSFRCQLTLHYQDVSVNAKSILDILMLAATRGAKIVVEGVGEDAEIAVKAIVELAKRKFHVKY